MSTPKYFLCLDGLEDCYSSQEEKQKIKALNPVVSAVFENLMVQAITYRGFYNCKMHVLQDVICWKLSVGRCQLNILFINFLITHGDA